MADYNIVNWNWRSKMKSMKNKLVDKLMVITATAIMVICIFNIFGVAGEEANAETGYSNSVVQSQLDKWLGDILNYGVVAEEATVGIDFESNIATNMLYAENSATMGASVSKGWVTEGKDFYVKDFEGALKIARRGATEFVIYTGLTIEGERTNQRVFFEEKDNNTTYINTDDYAYIPVWNCVDSHGEEILNITSELERVNEVFESYKNTGKETKNVEKSVNGNTYLVDVTKADEQVCFVNVNLSDITAFGPGTLSVNKLENQMIVFNINVDIEGAVNLSRFTVNGQSSANDDVAVAEQLIWNLAGYEGQVNISEMSGVVVAPLANVTITSTSRGRVICSEFDMTGGEMHFMSQSSKIEEEPETPTEPETTTTVPVETTTPEQITTTTVPVETTTPEQETTTTVPVETTTPEQETTTTVPVETTTPEQETTTTVPVETTTPEQETTTTVPVETTTPEQETTTTVPVETTTPEEETTTVPEETITTSIPYGEETTTPEEETTTTVPEETTTPEQETTTTVPEETTTPEEETTTEIETETTPDPETTTEKPLIETESTVSETTTVEEEENITTHIPFAGMDPETETEPEATTENTTEETTPEEEPIDFIIPFAGTSPETGDSSNVSFYFVLFMISATVLIGYKFGVKVKAD